MVATETTQDTRVLELFAELLEYPRPGVAETARETRALVASESAEAASLLAEFAAFADRTPHNTLEEVFTATFDLAASCHPYIGFHLFGEQYKRSVFLLELKDLYQKYGFTAKGNELQDHVSLMLRFMAICPNKEVISEIVREALLPTLEPMTVPPEPESLEEGEEAPQIWDLGDDYRRVLHALRLVLQVRYGAPAELEHIPIPDQSRLVS
ncbi:MAG: molecular chaperone TorD family protein [Candidatus Eremiobacteraeota bacterium]|nr:molecular chaperone TorD family protein [Candidatus Eremiobacteraeota bacterium]MBV8354475.1 molecular chaperone TorD family protein [Candidatus Eremiobacteraeota bacterium]